MRRNAVAGSPLTAVDLTQIEQYLPQLEKALATVQLGIEAGMSLEALKQELETHKVFLNNVLERFFPPLAPDQTPEHIT